MTKDDAPVPGRKPADPRLMTREERLKAALKANMARRKAQARARQQGPESDGQAGAEPQSKE